MHEHNGASQARAEAIDIGGSAVADIDGRTNQDSGCRRRPCLGISDQRHIARRSHLHCKLLEGPSAPELKGFKPRVVEAPDLQAFHSPMRSLNVRRRSGQSRPDRIRQCMKEDRCFGTVQSFSLDRPDHRLAVLLSREQKARGGQQHRNTNAFQYHLCRPHLVPHFTPWRAASRTFRRTGPATLLRASRSQARQPLAPSS